MNRFVFSGDPAFKFFYGMALVLEGQLQEGIRELDTVQSYTEASQSVYSESITCTIKILSSSMSRSR